MEGLPCPVRLPLPSPYIVPFDSIFPGSCSNHCSLLLFHPDTIASYNYSPQKFPPFKTRRYSHLLLQSLLLRHTLNIGVYYTGSGFGPRTLTLEYTFLPESLLSSILRQYYPIPPGIQGIVTTGTSSLQTCVWTHLPPTSLLRVSSPARFRLHPYITTSVVGAFGSWCPVTVCTLSAFLDRKGSRKSALCRGVCGTKVYRPEVLVLFFFRQQLKWVKHFKHRGRYPVSTSPTGRTEVKESQPVF